MSTRAERMQRGGGGYYADPASPIASTPQRHRRVGFGSRKSRGADVPAMPLSPMKKPNPITARRDVGFGAHPVSKVEEDDEGGEWRGAMFSPVFQPVKDGSTGGSRGKPSPGGLSHSTPPRKGGAAQCSLTSPSIYASSLTSKPVPRKPSPITTPSRDTSAAGGAAGAGASRTEVVMSSTVTTSVRSAAGSATSVAHREVHAVSYEEPGVASLAATDESWESEVSSEDLEGADMEDVEYDEFNPYLFMKLLPRYEVVAPKRRKLVLPKKARDAPRISLVLDLDETLVHCSIQPIPDADLTFRVPFNGRDYDVYVRKRPYLNHFLESVSRMFEVTVFTASQSVYAETLLNLIDPERRLVRHRLFREACLNVDGNYLKDLTVLGRDLRTTILVDNSPHAFGYQVDNGIPIESWFEDPTDTELLKLLQFLKTIRTSKDVRQPIRRKFRVWDLINAADASLL